MLLLKDAELAFDKSALAFVFIKQLQIVLCFEHAHSNFLLEEIRFPRFRDQAQQAAVLGNRSSAVRVPA